MLVIGDVLIVLGVLRFIKHDQQYYHKIRKHPDELTDQQVLDLLDSENFSD